MLRGKMFVSPDSWSHHAFENNSRLLYSATKKDDLQLKQRDEEVSKLSPTTIGIPLDFSTFGVA
jgi:hypothetical protein